MNIEDIKKLVLTSLLKKLKGTTIFTWNGILLV